MFAFSPVQLDAGSDQMETTDLALSAAELEGSLPVNLSRHLIGLAHTGPVWRIWGQVAALISRAQSLYLVRSLYRKPIPEHTRILFGSVAVAWYFSQYYMANTVMALSIAFVLMSAGILMILLFMQHHSLAMWMSRFKWLKEIKSVQKEVNYTPHILHSVALLSLFRFLIFVSQYLTLLYLFDLPIGWWQAMMGVFVIFVFQSGLPLPLFWAL